MIPIFRRLEPTNNYILVIPRDEDKHAIFEDIPKTFPSNECLRGFITGYGFGLIKVYTLQDFVTKFNELNIDIKKYFIKNVSIIEEVQ